MKKAGIFSILILLTISLFGCPKVLVPHEDYPDWDGDGVDDRTQVLDATGETLLAYGYSTEKLFSILDYYEQHGDKGWLAKSINVSKVMFGAVQSEEIQDDGTHIASYLFKGREDFNQDVSNWDVSNVTEMGLTFYNTTAFNQNISMWDISEVTDMSSMFVRAKAFNQDLSSWADKINNGTSMEWMFYEAESFYQDLSSWNVAGISTTDMFKGTPMENKAEWHPKGCRCGSTGCQKHRNYTIDEEGNVIE